MSSVPHSGGSSATGQRPLYVAPGAAPFVRRIAGRTTGTVITTPRWVRVGSDSLWLEPFSAPDLDARASGGFDQTELGLDRGRGD